MIAFHTIISGRFRIQTCVVDGGSNVSDVLSEIAMAGHKFLQSNEKSSDGQKGKFVFLELERLVLKLLVCQVIPPPG